jgi:Tfp pilus assembly protein PilO
VEGFYFAAGTLAAWAVLVTIIGVRVENFPATPGATRVVAAISVVLVVTTIGLAIYLSATEEHEKGGEKHAALQRI